MIGKTISHYRILEKLGEGGVGVVYKAEDIDLRRTVALKFLSPQALAGEGDAARFVHEAQAAAALNHPNICTVHEIGKYEGKPFIAMERIEGQSLKDVISSGLVEIDKAVDIAAQIATALQKAHEKDIVHRDIKPGNVMVTPEGQVKIMDFGLAKSSEHTRLTKTGSTVGTVAYMSPEQTRGDDVDCRTDVWSLGVILYEMITGQVPFRGEFEQAVLYSILNEEPELPSNLRSTIPGELQGIIGKALAKKADERYQSAGDMLADLNRLRGGEGASDLDGRSRRPAAGRNIILAGIGVAAIAAVILLSPYFAPPGVIARLKGGGTQDAPAVAPGEQRDESFVVVVAPFWGQSEEAKAEAEVMRALVERRLLAELGDEENVRILGKDLTEAPRSHNEARTLGRELDATVVLWGEVFVLREEVEIQPYMTLVGLDWRQQRNRAASALQTNLQDQNQLDMRKAKAEELGNMALVVAAIYYEDNDPDKALSVLRSISPPTSESLRWQGNVYSQRDEYEKAIRLFNEALDLNPNDAWAHAGIGNVYRWQGEYEEAIDKYKIACDLAPELAYPRFMLALAYDNRGDIDAARAEYEKSIELDPDYDVAYNSMGTICVRQQEFEEAIRYYKRAIELDPTYGEAYINLAWVYAFQGAFDQAIENALKAVGTYSNWVAGYSGLGVIYSMSGRHEEAVAAYRKALELNPERAETLYRLGTSYLMVDEVDSALSAYEKAIDMNPENAMLFWHQSIALTEAGMHDEAVKASETATQLRPSDHYMNLFHCILLHRAGREEEGRGFIAECAKSVADSSWAAPVVYFYAGERSADEVLRAAADPDSLKNLGQLCEAYYYLGMAHLLALTPETSPADTLKAIEYLDRCAATDMIAYTEYDCARRELTRLTR